MNSAAQMWQMGAASQLASQKYQMKTAGKGGLQKQNSLAAEPTYQARMQRVIQTGARARGVQSQDPSAYERGIQTKGIQNRVAGIQAVGAAGWAAGFQPYAPVIDSVRAGFGPKSDDVLQNVVNRTGRLAQALRQAKEGGVRGGGVTAVGTPMGITRSLY